MRKIELENCPQWLLDADTENEDVFFEIGVLIWRGGDFLGGNFLGGDFRGGDFRGGDFRGGNFWGESLTCSPLSIYGLRWGVQVTPTMLHIGCQHHTHDTWASFNDEEIAGMAIGASEFWTANKDILLSLCASVAK